MSKDPDRGDSPVWKVAGTLGGRGDYCEKGWIGQAGTRMWTFLYVMIVSLNFILCNMRSHWNILSRGMIWVSFCCIDPSGYDVGCGQKRERVEAGGQFGGYCNQPGERGQ